MPVVGSYVGGSVLYDPPTGRLFALNPTAATVLSSLKAGRTYEAIAMELAQEHSLEIDAVRRDVGALIRQLQHAGLFAPIEEGHREAAVTSSVKPTLDACYQVIAGGKTIRVSCYSEIVAKAFGPLAAPALVHMQDFEHHLSLFHHGSRFLLTCNGAIVDDLEAAPSARWALIRRMVQLSRYPQWTAMLHAGAISTSKRQVLLICGDSGSGKSSLTAALVHAGNIFMSDDIVPIDQRHNAWPVKLAMSLKKGIWPIVSAMFPAFFKVPSVLFGGREMRFIPPPVGHASPAPVAAIIFPNYAPGSEPSLKTLDPLESLRKLGMGGSALPQSNDEFQDFLDWWAALPAYQLSYSNLDHAVEMVRELA